MGRLNAFIWLMPPLMNISAPQLITWLPTLTLAGISPMSKLFANHRSSKSKRLVASRRAGPCRSVRRV
ncbi:hypothetical protein D3C75_1333050 [compost metagenome]